MSRYWMSAVAAAGLLYVGLVVCEIPVAAGNAPEWLLPQATEAGASAAGGNTDLPAPKHAVIVNEVNEDYLECRLRGRVE